MIDLDRLGQHVWKILDTTDDKNEAADKVSLLLLDALKPVIASDPDEAARVFEVLENNASLTFGLMAKRLRARKATI